MQDKYFDIDEMMVDYAEMTSFNFNSTDYWACSAEKSEPSEYSHQPYTFKYGNYDLGDLLHNMFTKISFQKG